MVNKDYAVTVFRFIKAAAAAVLALSVIHPLFTPLSLAGSVIYYFRLRRAYRMPHVPLVKAIAAGVITAAVFAAAGGLFARYGMTELFRLPDGNGFCLEPVVYGGLSGAAFVTAGVIFAGLNTEFPPEKFVYLFGRFLPRTALTLSLTMRFAPRYAARAKETYDIMRVRGNDMPEKRGRGRFKLFADTLSAVTDYAVTDSFAVADTVLCRGYGRRSRHTFAAFFTKTRQNYALQGVIAAVCGIGIACAVYRGLTVFWYDPVLMPKVARYGLSDIAACAAWAAFMMI